MNTTESIKRFLGKSFEIAERMAEIEERIEEIRAAQLTPSTDVTGDRVQSSRSHDRLENMSIEILELYDKYAAEALKLVEHEAELKRITDNLENSLHKTIMIWRYICRLNWDEVAQKMGYSTTHIFRIHSDMMKRIDARQEAV